MAKVASIVADFELSSVAIEDELTSISMDVRQQVIQVDGLSSVGPERVQGNYDWSFGLEGTWDGASGQGDSLLFDLVASTSGTVGFEPDGVTAGPSNPNYDGSVLLESYSIKSAVGAANTYSATLQGSGALSRAVA